jgi:phosphohistidine phosphatase SixA
MRLILVRHAKAEPGAPDAERPLTQKGRERARELGELLAARRPDAVVSSPLRRALETAAPIAEAAGLDVEVDDRLSPGATTEDVRAAVARRGQTVVTVGHAPDCEEVFLDLTGREEQFKTGAFAEVDL